MVFDGLPDDGDWVVRDNPTNLSVEVWNRTTADGQAVDWAWRERWTDSGAFQGSLDDGFSIRITASFDVDAAIDPLKSGSGTQ